MITGGKSFVSSPPAFSNDAKRLLVCTGNTVSVFSTSTGLQISELEGHGAQVTSVIVVPASSPASKLMCYCWTASLDGKIKYWDFAAPELMTTIDIGSPIHSMTQRPGLITSSPSGKYIGTYERRKLRIWEIPEKDSEHVGYKKIRLHHTKSFTALAFHPTERVVAAGDVTGRILIWRGVGHKTCLNDGKLISGGLNKDAEDKPGVRDDDDADSCTTWHWHSSQVNVLFFSSDGAYLYSGGREGVLVVWQLDTGKKKFLPRIGSPLLYFVHSPDPSLSSPSSSHMEIYEGFGSGVVFNHTSGLLAVPTENYRVQFYNLFDDREISEVKVNLVALSPDGSTMSTVETRLPEEGLGSLVSLKFWACGSQNKHFSLSTVIYEPHGKKPMTAAAFSGDGSVLAVAAEKVITLWDPDRNTLLAVIGDSLEAQGGGLSFVWSSPTSEDGVAETKASDEVLAYINGTHEYVLLSPHGEQASNLSFSRQRNFSSLEEKERFGYASIYGELPEFSLKIDQTPFPSMPSEKTWKTIFSGPSHSLPPLPKLCSDFLESLLERRSALVE
ncbi:UNVERIFIED_CONTAM: U3 small nucleolar RNA-associated protein 17 [Sesamum radiatum]|uniref:U3 small nucleolar RNA-associated protein 17 n=1 Tax=Sesamum radiatum TaxID=300843 RepID=A0AAW2T3B9_SESRA